jgi:restriction system protein
MAVPTYDRFIEPLLRYLGQHPQGALARDAHEAAAMTLGLSEADRQELLPSGAQLIYKNRAGWAHDRLKRAGLSSSPRRGFWQLTDKGREYAQRFPAQLSPEELERLALGFIDVRLRPTAEGAASPQAPTVAEIQQATPASAVASPDDRLEQALKEIRQTVLAEVLDALSRVTPTFFESIVLELLHRMGYGASRADLQRVGGTGDGGIDGVISLDRLGLEKVLVQAKRWQNVVGRPEIQAFFGALAGQRARRGVFITTSRYTEQAIDFARSVEGIVLVDGPRLAELMIDHEVGVQARTVRVPKLDSDYFDEESG